MFIGLCEFFIYIPDCNSLKDKRSILNAFKLSMRKRYNISIAEIGYKNTWKKSVIGIGCVSDNRKFIDRVMEKVIQEVESYPKIQLIDFQKTNL